MVLRLPFVLGKTYRVNEELITLGGEETLG